MGRTCSCVTCGLVASGDAIKKHKCRKRPRRQRAFICIGCGKIMPKYEKDEHWGECEGFKFRCIFCDEKFNLDGAHEHMCSKQFVSRLIQPDDEKYCEIFEHSFTEVSGGREEVKEGWERVWHEERPDTNELMRHTFRLCRCQICGFEQMIHTELEVLERKPVDDEK